MQGKCGDAGDGMPIYDSVSCFESPLKTDLEIQHLLWPLICHVDVSPLLDITPESTDAAKMDR